MKKYSVCLAILPLILASLSCQTIMGGGGNDFEVPEMPQLPQTNGGDEIEIPTIPPVTTDGDDSDDGGFTVGGESEFPVTSDAFNVVVASNMVTFQTNMSTDDVLKFYRDQFASQGYVEDESMAITFGKTFTLAFNGHESGKVIYVIGADAADGSIYVTITLG